MIISNAIGKEDEMFFLLLRLAVVMLMLEYLGKQLRNVTTMVIDGIMMREHVRREDDENTNNKTRRRNF